MADHAISDHPAVQAQLDRLAALSPGRDVLGLDRIRELCARLGNPQNALPPVFHVAGTNGKGSTCAFLRAILEADGRTVHAYASPHLVRFNERIRVAGSLINDDDLAAVLAEVLDVADGLNASFFEITTAAAFLAFARTPADACIIEVGLGGRLDATNIIAAPIVCGIATLGIDHEGFLLAPEDSTPTDPMARIGFEKAGIAKKGVPIVISRYAPNVRDTVAAKAEEVGAILIEKGGAWNARVEDEALIYTDANGTLTLPLPTMQGAHQAANAALAVAMIRHQSALLVPADAMARGIAAMQWPARMQRMGGGPITALAESHAVWLDGGHNNDAGAALAAFFAGSSAKMHLIIGMLSNKDAGSILRPLTPHLASVTMVPVHGHEYHGADAFAASLNGAVNVTFAADLPAALTALPRDGADVLIGGSLYLCGEALRLNHEFPT
jgi:dihydrofolate synthase / folylpolyglutamate synthase